MFSILVCDLDLKAFSRFLNSSRIVHVSIEIVHVSITYRPNKRVDIIKEL